MDFAEKLDADEPTWKNGASCRRVGELCKVLSSYNWQGCICSHMRETFNMFVTRCIYDTYMWQLKQKTLCINAGLNILQKYFLGIFVKVIMKMLFYACLNSVFLHIWLLLNLVTIGKLVLTPLLNNVRLTPTIMYLGQTRQLGFSIWISESWNIYKIAGASLSTFQ